MPFCAGLSGDIDGAEFALLGESIDGCLVESGLLFHEKSAELFRDIDGHPGEDFVRRKHGSRASKVGSMERKSSRLCDQRGWRFGRSGDGDLEEMELLFWGSALL